MNLNLEAAEKGGNELACSQESSAPPRTLVVLPLCPYIQIRLVTHTTHSSGDGTTAGRVTPCTNASIVGHQHCGNCRGFPAGLSHAWTDNAAQVSLSPNSNLGAAQFVETDAAVPASRA